MPWWALARASRTVCAGLLYDRWPELEIPSGALDRERVLDRLGRRLAQAAQTTDIRIARELVREIRAVTRRIREIERELAGLVGAKAPGLLAIPGCGVLTAALDHRRDGGPGTLLIRCKACSNRWRGTDPRLIGPHDPLPARSRRESQTECCSSPHRDRPGAG
jgi:hypothetical protein